MLQQKTHTVGLLLALALLNGCSYFASSVTQDFGQRLQQTVLNQNDPETVTNAMPAYLLTLEAMQTGDPGNKSLTLSTANLYGAYIGLLADGDPVRKTRLARKALDFSLQAACLHADSLCALQQESPADLQAVIESCGKDDIEILYSVATAWASWIQANKNDWNAIAQLAQVKLLMQQVVAIDEHYKQGAPYLYLAILESLIPATLGGKPEVAKAHFDRAMQLAPDNLMVPVLYAKHYARMMFDRELHDRLLQTALSSRPNADGLTLINTLAQKQAQELLNSANNYF